MRLSVSVWRVPQGSPHPLRHLSPPPQITPPLPAPPHQEPQHLQNKGVRLHSLSPPGSLVYFPPPALVQVKLRAAHTHTTARKPLTHTPPRGSHTHTPPCGSLTAGCWRILQNAGFHLRLFSVELFYLFIYYCSALIAIAAKHLVLFC